MAFCSFDPGCETAIYLREAHPALTFWAGPFDVLALNSLKAANASEVSLVAALCVHPSRSGAGLESNSSKQAAGFVPVLELLRRPTIAVGLR
jgi:hypothetical protein